jgi:hypothetical protein
VAVNPRVIVVIFLVFVYAFIRRVIRSAMDARRQNTAPRSVDASLPSRITEGADRTWAVFTTPWCATCDPVVEQLRAAEPGSRVIKIDSTVERSLAEALKVRAAPTAVLARADGTIEVQLVGPEAVDDYLKR